MAYIAATGNGALVIGSTGVVVTHGLTLQDGDVLVAFCGAGTADLGSGGETINAFASTGWTAAAGAFEQQAGGNDRAGSVLYKVITDAGSEPSTYTFTRTNDTVVRNQYVRIVQMRGIDTSTPLDVAVAKSQGTNDFTPDNADITPVNASDILACHIASFGDTEAVTGITVGAPANYTLAGSQSTFDGNAASSPRGILVAVAYRENQAAGAQSIGSWTHSPGDATREYITYAVALRRSSATSATAGTTSGTGVASSPTPRVRPSAGHAAATGAAHQPPMPIYAQAGHASADGWASQGEGAELDVDPATIEATAAAGAASAAVAVPIGHASATGAAGAPTPGAGAPAGIASFNATAEAHDPTIDTVAPTVVAEHATATGAASDATPGLSLPAEHLAATAEASGIGASVSVSPSVASATGAAQTATATVPGVAGTAMVQAAAQAPSTSVKVNAGHASASASADAVAIAMAVYPAAASAIAAAYPLQAAVVASAGIAQATGATYDIRPPFDWDHVHVYLNPAPAPSAVLGPAPAPSAVMGDT